MEFWQISLYYYGLLLNFCDKNNCFQTQNAADQRGTSYIRWGRKTCENSTVVYKGGPTASTFLHVRHTTMQVTAQRK